MAATKSKLDSPAAIEAFQVAMGRKIVLGSSRDAQPIEHPENTPTIEPSVKTPPEGSTSNEEQTITTPETKLSTKTISSNIIKCLNCGQEMNQILTTSPAKPQGDDEKDAMGFTMPAPQEQNVLPKAGNINVEIGTTNKTSTPASVTKTTGTTTTPVLHGTEETTPLSNPGTPVHHRALADLVSDNVVTPVNGALRVPQNSPANVLIALPDPDPVPAAPKETKNPFTREEAHDVVIDIFKELAALSERSPKNSPTKAMSAQGRGIAPPNAMKSAEPDKKPVDIQTNPSTRHQSGLFTSPKDSKSNSSPSKFFVTDENLPPHLGTKVHNLETRSATSAIEDDSSPPHLRTPKHKLGKSVHPNKNYFSVLDPSHQSAFVGKLKESVNTKESSELDTKKETRSKPTGLSSFSTSSSGSSSTPVANRQSDQEDTKPNPFRESISPTAEVTKPVVDKGAAFPTSPNSPAKSFEIKHTPRDLDNPVAHTSLPSWFLEKYGSKKTTTPSKTVPSEEEATEDLEHQTVFKAWPGQSERTRPAANIRTCHIKNIPSSSTPEFVCSLVFGGPLEYVRVDAGAGNSTASATVRFLSAEDCKRFYEATANGLPYKKGPQGLMVIAMVTLGKEVDVVGGRLAQSIDQGATRCLRALPVDPHLEKAALVKFAVEQGRQLEGLEDGVTKTGSRCVVWRFCDVAHAVAFRGGLARNQDFESCNISFSDDPCALRDGVEGL